METVPRDVTIEMMLQLDAQSILNLCKTSTKFASICSLSLFWKRKIQKDYPQINIDDVTEYKNLYLYLKKKPRFPLNKLKPEWGDLSSNGKAVFGPGGRYYSMKDIMISGIAFPSFPPEYFSQFDTNIFLVKNFALKEIVENIISNERTVSFVTGPFGEKYTINFRTDNVQPELFNEIIKRWKSFGGYSFFRFINGMFYKDMHDTVTKK